MGILVSLGVRHDGGSCVALARRRRVACGRDGWAVRLQRARARAVLLGACALLFASAAHADQRQRFLDAERAVAAGDGKAVARALRQLEDYPLTPYLELAWAERRMRRIGEQEMSALLARHADVATAGLLRRRWIARLARQGRWQRIVAEAPARDASGGGDTATDCRVAEALWRTGRAGESWRRVDALWLNGRSLPDACDPVLAAWRAAGRLTPELGWSRVVLAVRSGNARLARYLGRFLPSADASLLERWLAMRSDGRGLRAFLHGGGLEDPRRREVLLDSVRRLAARDPGAAAALVESASALAMDEALRASLRASVARQLARAGDPLALRWLQGVKEPRALEAGAVLAIAEGRWPVLEKLIEAMPAEQAAQARWRYWRAAGRALAGQLEGGAALRTLAGERGYYAFLAAQRSGLDYRLEHSALTADADSRQTVASRPATRRALEWHALARPVEARREWRRLLDTLPAELLEAASRLAHEHDWHEAAIRTAARAQSWDDLELRFPLAHGEEVLAAASRSGLSASRIYAVVRQESAFMADVRSSAGALGLMQLLPRTAREVARRAGMRRPRTAELLDPGRNLLLGSLYLARLERRYGGHPVLASAAYNAGPARVRRWRRGEAMSAETWIETIPFRETRRYVQRVLAYQVIYAHRLGQQPPRLDALMPPVPARSASGG